MQQKQTQMSAVVSYYAKQDDCLKPKGVSEIRGEVQKALVSIEAAGLEPFAAVPFPVTDVDGSTITNGGLMVLGRSRVVQVVDNLSSACVVA